MTTQVDSDLAERVSFLERRRPYQWMAMMLFLLLGTLIGAVVSESVTGAFAQARRTDEILTVRGLIVVDEKGVERVRIGSRPQLLRERVRASGREESLAALHDFNKWRAGEATLRSIAQSSGLIRNNRTAEITPSATFTGNKHETSWLGFAA